MEPEELCAPNSPWPRAALQHTPRGGRALRDFGPAPRRSCFGFFQVKMSMRSSSALVQRNSIASSAILTAALCHGKTERQRSQTLWYPSSCFLHAALVFPQRQENSPATRRHLRTGANTRNSDLNMNFRNDNYSVAPEIQKDKKNILQKLLSRNCK